MRICISFILLLLLCSNFSMSAQVLQNMVKNPSFEQYARETPKDLGEINKCAYWSSATKAGGDYFHTRAHHESVRAPRNKMGKADPKSGRAYGGFYAYTSRYSKRNYREYLQVKLKHPMGPGEEYCVKMQVYLAESANRALGALGVAGAKFQQQQDHETNITNLHTTYLLKGDRRPLTERKWVEIKGTYKALGGETFLLIGNFDDDKRSKVTGAIEIDSFRNPHVDFAYYFVDNVCVTSYKSNFTCNCGDFDYAKPHREKIVVDFKLNPKTYRLNEVDILQQVQFDKGKTTFKAGSTDELDHFIVVLQKNPSYVVEISGHTSDQGNPMDNQFLSKRRAKAVYDYLIAGGIEAERLTYRGFGQSRPLTLNNSPENRAKNERIQIKLLKK